MKVYTETKEQKFEPFEITIKIENKDDLLNLLGHTNYSPNSIIEILNKYWINNFDSDNTSIMPLFSFLQDKARELNLIQVGDPWFQDVTGEYWSKRMKELREQGADHVSASKNIGWEK
jgi:hypothetical protein